MADAAIAFTCFNCEETFHRRSSGKSDARKCCSRLCGFQWQAKIKALLRPVAHTVSRPVCPTCRQHFTAGKRQTYCSTSCYPIKPRAEVGCEECKALFVPPLNSHGRFCPTCLPLVNKRQRLERFKASPARAIARKARKLKQRGVQVERVDPLVVLNRDAWTCQLCGVKTPKRLRGSYDDCAPEVDHIVPIAQGGEHSYRNTQCACRRCNIAKSGKAKGQMRLFG